MRRQITLIGLLLCGLIEARKQDSRAPDVLYQTIVRNKVQLGGKVSGDIIVNEWTNGPDQEECATVNLPPVEDGTPLTIIEPPKPTGYDYYGYEPPVIICDEITDNFSLEVRISLGWSSPWDAPPVIVESVTISPNGANKQVPFEINVPQDMLLSKTNEWASLRLRFETYLDGTKFGIQSDEYINLIDRESIIVQSDKAKYKPGNRVNFRFLFMDVNLKPVEVDELSYVIKSPSNNKMAQKIVTNPDSVFTGRFQLDKYAEQGVWKIEISSSNENGKMTQSYSFDVEEYVLPTFEGLMLN
jgi:hypothetical protein